MNDNKLKKLIKEGTVEAIREACKHLLEENADEARWTKVFSKSLIAALVKKWDNPVIIELCEQFWKHSIELFNILGETAVKKTDSLMCTNLLRYGDVGTILLLSTFLRSRTKIFGEVDQYGIVYEGGRAIDVDFAKKLLVYKGEIELVPNNIAGEVAAILASRKEKVKVKNFI